MSRRPSKLTLRDKAFYSGILSALAVIVMHDQETIFREIVNTTDEKELLAVAVMEEEMEWSGLTRYGYGTSKAAEE